MVTVSPPAFLGVSFSLVVSSDWKNWILDWSVFAAVAEVRGAGVGLATAAEALVVKVDPKAAGLEEGAGTGREGGGDGVAKAPDKLGGVLVLSFSHVCPSLGEASLLVFAGCRPGAACWLFVGKSLSGGPLSAGASDLTSQSELLSDRFQLPSIIFNHSEKHLTLHSSCGKASRPPVVAAPGERACCRRRTCCSASPSDGISQPGRPRKEEFHRHPGVPDDT